MQRVVLACLRNILLQSVAYIAVQALDVEVHVILMEFLEHLRFREDVGIDTKKCWNLVFLNVHQVLVGQVAEQNVASVSSVLCEAIKNALLLLNLVITICIAVCLFIGILLVFHELIEAILFIVLVVLHVLLGIAIFNDKK